MHEAGRGTHGALGAPARDDADARPDRRPSFERRAAFRVFAAFIPALLYSLYFLALQLSGGTWWTTAVWTGSEMVVVGAELDGGNHASTGTAVAEAFNPATNTWRSLPDAPLSPQASEALWFDGEVFAWVYGSDSARYLPAEDRWQGLGKLPLDHGECYVNGVSLESAVLAWNCGYPDAWYPDAGWSDVSGGPAGQLPVTRVIGTYGRAYAAGSVAIVWNLDNVERNGVPVTGSSDGRQHLWVWRPTSNPPAPPQPTKEDAEELATNFVVAWVRYETYLPTLATQDVLDRCGQAAGECSALAGQPNFDWLRGSTTQTRPGIFEVVTGPWKDGEIVPTTVLTIGPGTTADGRQAQLVVIDFRPAA